MISELTGEQDHENITEIESIFGLFQHVDPNAFRNCMNLQKLTLLNGRLERIPSLVCVRETLVHLCLSAQRITHIECMDLPHLRALYLQQNAIQRIQGLEQCRKLQTLWLYGNQIDTIENLEYNTDLRELWLQDNRIRSFECDETLASLVHLHTLGLAHNMIDGTLDGVEKALRRLHSLRHLSFEDAHFGTNPIVKHTEYQRVIMIAVPQLLTLDGKTIQSQERTAIVNAFVQQNIAFNDRVADLTFEYEHDIRTIQSRRERGISNSNMLEQELVHALNELEQEVVQGQEALERERARQQTLRTEHCERLRMALDTLCKETTAMIDAQLAQEMQALDQEEEEYEFLEQQAQAEHTLALTVATLQSTFPGKIAFQHVSEHSPEYRMVQSHFHPDERITLLQVYRFYHQELINKFTSTQPAKYLYTVVTEDEAMNILQSGWQPSLPPSTTSPSQWLVLFSNPIQAMSFYHGEQEKVMQTHVLLLCQVDLISVLECPIDPSVGPFSSLNAMISWATLSDTSPSCFLHIAQDDIYLLERTSSTSDKILPELVVLTSQRNQPKRCIKPMEPTPSPEQLIESFYQTMERTVVEYEGRLRQEMEPEQWREKTESTLRKQQRDRELKELKRQIEQERRRLESTSICNRI